MNKESKDLYDTALAFGLALHALGADKPSATLRIPTETGSLLYHDIRSFYLTVSDIAQAGLTERNAEVVIQP